MLNPVAPRLPRLYALALPCGVMVVPFHRRSPPEFTVAPVSRFKALPDAREVVWLMSALAATARANDRTVRRSLKDRGCCMFERYNRLSVYLAQRVEKTVMRSRGIRTEMTTPLTGLDGLPLSR